MIVSAYVPPSDLVMDMQPEKKITSKLGERLSHCIRCQDGPKDWRRCIRVLTTKGETVDLLTMFWTCTNCVVRELPLAQIPDDIRSTVNETLKERGMGELGPALGLTFFLDADDIDAAGARS